MNVIVSYNELQIVNGKNVTPRSVIGISASQDPHGISVAQPMFIVFMVMSYTIYISRSSSHDYSNNMGLCASTPPKLPENTWLIGYNDYYTHPDCAKKDPREVHLIKTDDTLFVTSSLYGTTTLNIDIDMSFTSVTSYPLNSRNIVIETNLGDQLIYTERVHGDGSRSVNAFKTRSKSKLMCVQPSVVHQPPMYKSIQ